MPRLDISAPREPAWLGHSRGGLASSSSRGLDPREGLGCLVDEDGPYGLLLGHAMGRRQASLGTPVPRTPTVAPGPKVRSGLASRRSQGSSLEHRGPQKPAASVDAWWLIGRECLRFPTLPRQLLALTKAGAGSSFLHCLFLASLQIPFLTLCRHCSTSAPSSLCICRPWRRGRSRLPRPRLGTSPLLRFPLSRRRALPSCAC